MALQSTLEAVWLGVLLSSLWKGEQNFSPSRLEKMYAFVLQFVLNFKSQPFFVCLFPVVAESKEQVLQSPTVDSLEGTVAEISCNHSVFNVYGFFWYLHYPGFAARLLIKGLKPSQQGRYNMTYESSLHHCSSSRCRRQMRGFTIVL